jgi:hypothetical protein
MTPTTTKRTPAKQAKTKTAAGMMPEAAPNTETSTTEKAPKLSAFARQVHANIKETLEGLLEGFVESAPQEEQRFMIDVINDWANIGGGYCNEDPGVG